MAGGTLPGAEKGPTFFLVGREGAGVRRPAGREEGGLGVGARLKTGRGAPAGIANARARSVAAPIPNREPQKSTAEGRKCGQLFSVEREEVGSNPRRER